MHHRFRLPLLDFKSQKYQNSQLFHHTLIVTVHGFLLRSSGQIPSRVRRFKDRSSAKIRRLSEAKVEPKREGLPRGIAK